MATFQRMIFKGDASSKIYPLYLLEDKNGQQRLSLSFRIYFIQNCIP